MADFFSVALSEHGRVAAALNHSCTMAPLADFKDIAEVQSSVMDSLRALSSGREESVLNSLLPQIRLKLEFQSQIQNLKADALQGVVQLISTEAAAFFQLRWNALDDLETHFRQWVEAEYDGFANFAKTNEPVWRAAAAEASMARMEAERSRREQAELQAALDKWRAMLRDQRSSLYESCSRQKSEWFQQSEDWFICMVMEEREQRGLAVRREQQRKSEEWAKNYGSSSSTSTANRPQSASAGGGGYYQPRASSTSSSSSGYYQPNASSTPAGGGYYQPRPSSGAPPVYAAASSGANFGISRPSQPTAVPNAKTGFQATPVNQYAPPPSLFGGSTGYR